MRCRERAVKLRLEWICSFEMSWKFLLARLLSFWGNFRVLDDFGLDRIWTCEIEFERFGCQLSWVLHCFHFWLHDTSMGFIRGNHCDLFCSCVTGCACIGSWMWMDFCKLPQVGIISFLSETLKCSWLHIACQDVRHASWGNSECGVYGSVNHLLRCEARTLGWEKDVVGVGLGCGWLSWGS